MDRKPMIAKEFKDGFSIAELAKNHQLSIEEIEEEIRIEFYKKANWYVLQLTKINGCLCYVQFPHNTLETALYRVSGVQVDELAYADRIRIFDELKNRFLDTDKKIIRCSDDNDLAAWIICHNSAFVQLLRKLNKQHIQVIPKCQIER